MQTCTSNGERKSTEQFDKSSLPLITATSGVERGNNYGLALLIRDKWSSFLRRMADHPDRFNLKHLILIFHKNVKNFFEHITSNV